MGLCKTSALLDELFEVWEQYIWAERRTEEGFIFMTGSHIFSCKYSSPIVGCWVQRLCPSPPPWRLRQPPPGLLSVWSQDCVEFKQQRGVAPLRLCLCLRSLPYNWGPLSCSFVSLLWEKGPQHHWRGTGRQLYGVVRSSAKTHSGQITQATTEGLRRGLIRQGWGEAKRQYTSTVAASLHKGACSAPRCSRAGIVVAEGL